MAMSPEKRASIEAAGFIVTTVDEFLGLTPEESAEVDRRARAAIQARHEALAANHTVRAVRVQRKRKSAAV